MSEDTITNYLNTKGRKINTGAWVINYNDSLYTVFLGRYFFDIYLSNENIFSLAYGTIFNQTDYSIIYNELVRIFKSRKDIIENLYKEKTL